MAMSPPGRPKGEFRSAQHEGTPVTMPQPIRILVVDDHTLFRRGLTALLTTQPRFDVVGEAGDAGEAHRRAAELQPDVILLDHHLPGVEGVDAIQGLREVAPRARILMLTVSEDGATLARALQRGASGYLLKRTPPAEIADAIQVASAGGSPMSPHIARQVVGFFHRTPPPKPDRALTVREQEVLDLLIKGKFYKEIATSLGVSIDTVRTHVRKVYDKLHIHSRTEIILKYGSKAR